LVELSSEQLHSSCNHVFQHNYILICVTFTVTQQFKMGAECEFLQSVSLNH